MQFRRRNSDSELLWYKLRKTYFLQWVNKEAVLRGKLGPENRKLAGSATYKQSGMVLSFNVSLYIQFIQSWKAKIVHLFSLFMHAKISPWRTFSSDWNALSKTTQCTFKVYFSPMPLPFFWDMGAPGGCSDSESTGACDIFKHTDNLGLTGGTFLLLDLCVVRKGKMQSNQNNLCWQTVILPMFHPF